MRWIVKYALACCLVTAIIVMVTEIGRLERRVDVLGKDLLALENR
jgi:hypothetical protein